MSQQSSLRLPIAQNQIQFRELVQDALKYAKSLGASDAAAEVSESAGLSVSVRNQDIETVEQTHDRSLDVTVFAGQKRGSASTSDFSAQALRETVDAAWHIARYTAADPAAGLPEPELLAREFPDLQLHSPWDIDAEAAAAIALEAERAARAVSPLITNTDGASVGTFEGHFVLGNSRGFLAGYPYSRHSLSVAPIAGRGAAMQRDYWYSADRQASRLADAAAVGRYAAERTLSRMSARRIKTGRFPVLFEAPLALGLLGALVQATSGGALYRKASFLVDSLGKPVLADHLQVAEDPFIPGAMGSSAFDDEGVRTSARDVVVDGVLQGYFLSSYTARKLNMQTTGNAGGSHNLSLVSRLTNPDDDFRAMLRKMGTGFLVTELIGQGVNYVTGDYSRGAFGYWVENGEIRHAVQEVTIAGNLADMFRQIVAVGADTITRGSKSSGSILIEQMAIAGQ
ncbi:metalloprotease PmbA [Eoetvoesiella caeni]|uniref:Microcin-processing peptidase 1 n=1 Tax=Eoetvoesiella caeni TaxID=645616 RepID=A0A366HCA7_9BURK|nr:metalloprotease PmbA [Eoetvoesiella caeni]MCI2809024.1 metalloprotease PmbA [Eoetvoesiella caeni]NYT55475.1 metalloprotease PmbA [Eoetvoesiella caeni]RBP40030.1 microcin-processing peptidase 1 [Eoetvoesiella caeni]